MPQDVAAVVLAAGKGTRFRSETAKVLHRAAGRTLLAHILASLRPLELGQVIVVVGHQADEVSAEAQAAGLDGLECVLQSEQLGTGHAVRQALPALDEQIRRVLIVYGDTPLITSETLAALLGDAEDHTAALLSARAADPAGYGRVVRDADGRVQRIVEHGDATDEQRRIDEINAGMYAVDRRRLEASLGGADADNAQGEVYLTDIVEHLTAAGESVVGTLVAEAEIAGVNDRAQLADAGAALRRRHLDRLMRDVGVTVIDPASTYVDVDVEVGRDAVLLPGTILEAGTVVAERARIGPNTHLTACEVGPDAQVHSTRATGSVIGPGAQTGPFAHLREGTRLEASSKAGAFVETKNATFATGAKASHIAYVGDATIGRDVNIGCGVVVVNYDGSAKHHTIVEDGAFVGSGCMLISPVTVGQGAYVAAGSTVTDDVPARALAIGRARQVNKDGWVDRAGTDG